MLGMGVGVASATDAGAGVGVAAGVVGFVGVALTQGLLLASGRLFRNEVFEADAQEPKSSTRSVRSLPGALKHLS